MGSSRQRVWFLAAHLKTAYGYDYDIIHSISYSSWLPSIKRFLVLKRFYSALRVTRNELLYVHKSLYPWDVILFILFAKKLLKKKFIYDLDDAEWIHSQKKSMLLARNADVVVAGSRVILQWALAQNPESLMIPTVFDHDVYQRYRVEHTQASPLTIGWTGMGKGHFLDGNFHMIRPALDELARRGLRFRFVVIGSQNYQPLKNYFANAPFETIFIDSLDWQNPESVPQTIKKYTFAVGLMPTSDTPFNRAKCGGKALEYMACGVPVIASPVGENSVVVEHKKTGFLAEKTNEWTSAIETLLTNAALRKTMGEAAMEHVRVHYSYQAVLPEYKKLFELL